MIGRIGFEKFRSPSGLVPRKKSLKQSSSSVYNRTGRIFAIGAF